MTHSILICKMYTLEIQMENIYPKIFSNTKNTVVALKTFQTIAKLYSCGIKNTLNEVILLTAMTKFIYKQKRMKTTIILSQEF